MTIIQLSTASLCNPYMCSRIYGWWTELGPRGQIIERFSLKLKWQYSYIYALSGRRERTVQLNEIRSMIRLYRFDFLDRQIVTWIVYHCLPSSYEQKHNRLLHYDTFSYRIQYVYEIKTNNQNRLLKNIKKAAVSSTELYYFRI